MMKVFENSDKLMLNVELNTAIIKLVKVLRQLCWFADFTGKYMTGVDCSKKPALLIPR